jgi:hypothetical protein
MKKIYFSIISIAIFLSFASTTLALPPIGGGNRIRNPLLDSTIQSPTTFQAPSLLGNTLSVLITLGFVIGSFTFVLYFTLGAIKWIMSSGDKTRAETARNQITQAALGLVILFTLYIILTIINVVFKINIVDLTLPQITP